VPSSSLPLPPRGAKSSSEREEARGLMQRGHRGVWVLSRSTELQDLLSGWWSSKQQP
jgi:hypothetical protein